MDRLRDDAMGVVPVRGRGWGRYQHTRGGARSSALFGI